MRSSRGGQIQYSSVAMSSYTQLDKGFVDVNFDSDNARHAKSYVGVKEHKGCCDHVSAAISCFLGLFLPEYYREKATDFSHLASFSQLLPYMAFTGVLAGVNANLCYHEMFGFHHGHSMFNKEYLGFVMGATVFMSVFRNGISYGKFWQAATTVSMLKVSMQDLAQISASTIRRKDVRDQFNRYSALFFHLAVEHVRPKDDSEEMKTYEEKVNSVRYKELTEAVERTLLERVKKRKALVVLAWMSRLVRVYDKELEPGEDTIVIMQMEEKIGDLIACFNGMDKLRFTSFPFPFAQLQVWLSLNVILIVPFVISGSYSDNLLSACLTGPSVAAMVTMFLLGILAVSVEIEDPFGLEMHDLELCDDIKTSRADIKMFLEHVHDDQYQQAVLEETALF